MNIGELLADKGSTLPLLSTVLRVDLTLQTTTDTRSKTIDLLTKWVDERTEAGDRGFSWALKELPFEHSSGFMLDWAEDEESFALSLERPDSREPERSWLLDVILRRSGMQSILSTRLSVRQPRSSFLSRPGAPRFISQIVDEIGALDLVPLSSASRRVDEEGIAAFAEFATSGQRTLPIIAISEDQRRVYSQQPLVHIDPEYLASVLSGTAHVVVLSRLASQWITDHHGKQYSAFFGAVRCFNPGFSFASDPRSHRLWLDVEVDRSEANRKNGFSDTVLRHVFAQVTASFEALPLAAPRTLRRIEVLRVNERQATARESSVVELAQSVAEVSQPQTAPTEQPSSQDGLLLAKRDLELRELQARIESATREYARLEEQREQATQSLRGENAEINRKLSEEKELREEFERENARLEAQLAIYTGKTSSGEDTLAARFLSAFANALGSARDLIDTHAQLERDVNLSVSEIELLRDQLAEARAERYKALAQLSNVEANGTIPTQLEESALILRDANSLETFFAAHDNCVVTNNARRSFVESPYLDTERMQEALTLLRDCYLPMRLCKDKVERDGLYASFQKSLVNGAYTWGPTATDVGRGRSPEDHTQKTKDGRTIECEKIRDKTSTFNRQEFLCVYFAWDGLHEELYLKAFRHGDTPSSRT